MQMPKRKLIGNVLNVIYLVVASVIVIVAGIQCGAGLGIYFACVQTEKPNLWIFIDFLSFVVGQSAAMESNRICVCVCFMWKIESKTDNEFY